MVVKITCCMCVCLHTVHVHLRTYVDKRMEGEERGINSYPKPIANPVLG